MKPSLKIFKEYMQKFPSKRVCMRMIYKDYQVKDEEKEKYRKAWELLNNAKMATQEAEPSSEEEKVEGKT